MKHYLSIFLDESGASNEHYFVVGGFYIISKSWNEIEHIKNKIRSNIRKTEMAIAKYRFKTEKNKFQYIESKSKFEKSLKREIKWSGLSTENKIFLTNEIIDNGQKNIFMICDLFKWKTKSSKGYPHLDFVYNFAVRLMIERICKLKNISINDQLFVKIELDQRNDIPKSHDKGINTILHKARGLEEYLNTTFYFDKELPLINVCTKQFDSRSNFLIRYADYVDGVVREMIYYQDKGEIKHDAWIKECYKNLHINVPCHCERTIRTNEGPIKELESLCKELNKKNAL